MSFHHPPSPTELLDPEGLDPALASSERLQAARRSTWVSVAVNVVLTTAQILAGVFTRSQALIADGIHSLSDLVSDAVVLVASHHSQKDADAHHPYGHQRYENAATLILGLLLLSVGVAMAWHAVQRLVAHDDIPPVSHWALWVAGITLVIKETLFRYLLRVAQRVKSSLLVANAWHARSDAASSLVAGLGILGHWLGYPVFDPIAALIVGGMIAHMGWRFGWGALQDLTDRTVDQQERADIEQTLLDTPGVQGVHDLRIRKMGDMLIADAHIEVHAQLSVLQGHDIAVEARRRVLQRHRVLNLLTHLDPWQCPDADHPGAAHPATPN